MHRIKVSVLIKKCLIITGILFFGITNVFAQNVVLSGVVSDSANTPLANANILAFPKNTDERTQFAITNDKGKYVLRLEKEVAYLGYQKLVFEHTASQDAPKT